MPSINRKREKLLLIGGAAFLFLVILSGWIPRGCPLLQRTISSCPSNSPHIATSTPEQAELNRIPHNSITTGLAEFSVKVQDFRGTTAVRFPFRADLTKVTAYLWFNKASGMEKIALVTNPLLTKLNWTRTSQYEPQLTIYSKNGDFTPITQEEILANLPPKKNLAMDEVAASILKLEPSKYTPIDTLTSLDGITTIITTYHPPMPNGETWYDYDVTFNLQDAKIFPDGTIKWQLTVTPTEGVSEPFLMGNVHIDYKTMGTPSV